RRSITASSLVAFSPRAHVAALSAEHAVVTRLALGSIDDVAVMLVLLSWLFSTRKEKPVRQQAGSTGYTGLRQGASAPQAVLRLVRAPVDDAGRAGRMER